MSKPKTFSFTKQLERLEEIVAQLENPQLELEDTLNLLEEGVKLHKQCTDQLKLADKKIKTFLNEEIPG